MRNAALYSQCQCRRTDRKANTPHKSIYDSQVDNPGVVIEELSTVFGDFPRNSVGILDVPLAEILQNASQTIIPLLFLFLRLARIGSPELDEELLTYKPEVSLRTRGGLDKREVKTRCGTHQ
jgi:hypothetical protein